MSTTNLDNLMADLLAIPEENVKTPAIPVSIYIQEAEDLKVWAEEDKEALYDRGLESVFLESLKPRATVCREAQSIWAKEFKSQEDAEKEWLLKAPDAFKLRDSLVNSFRYAFRKDEKLLAKVAVIAEGTSREDMIQDLSDLSVLGAANVPLLEKVKFDLSKLDIAADTSKQMAGLLAGAKGAKESASRELDIRNRAYTHLKEAVDEIRDCGKYVFDGNEKRLKGYRSDFFHKLNLKNRNKGDDSQTKS